MAGHVSSVARARADLLVARVLAIIEERAGDATLSRKTIARELGVSSSLLAHAVKRWTGFTITQHICRVRLATAEALLLDPTRSIKQVAFVTGFRSPSTFDRWFLNTHHTTPRDWRAKELTRRSA